MKTRCFRDVTFMVYMVESLDGRIVDYFCYDRDTRIIMIVLVFAYNEMPYEE